MTLLWLHSLSSVNFYGFTFFPLSFLSFVVGFNSLFTNCVATPQSIGPILNGLRCVNVWNLWRDNRTGRSRDSSENWNQKPSDLMKVIVTELQRCKRRFRFAFTSNKSNLMGFSSASHSLLVVRSRNSGEKTSFSYDFRFSCMPRRRRWNCYNEICVIWTKLIVCSAITAACAPKTHLLTLNGSQLCRSDCRVLTQTFLKSWLRLICRKTASSRRNWYHWRSRSGEKRKEEKKRLEI